MAITPLPTPPSRQSPGTFSATADAFLGALPAFATEANALATAVNDNAVIAADAEIICAQAAIDTAADRVQTGLDAASASASAASAAAIAGAFVGTSTTSIAIGTGSKTFVTQSGEQYSSGIWMTAVSAADGGNWMFGQVVSYSGTSLVLDVQATGGTGTFADWNLSLTGARGPAGTGITPQSVGFTMTGGTTAKTLTVDVNATVSELVKTYSAVATGAIDAGDFVELMPDGTVRVAQYVSPVSAGSATDFAAYNTNHGWDSCYDSSNQRVVVIYRRASDSYPMAVVGTVSGDLISFGTPVAINAGATGGTSLLTCCFDSVNNKVVVFYATSGGQPVARVGTVSDTTILFGDVSYPQPGNYAASDRVYNVRRNNG